MKNLNLIFISFLIISCSDGESYEVKFTNTIDSPRSEVVAIPVKKWNLSMKNSYVIKGNRSTDVELVDPDGDGYADKVMFMIDFKPNESLDLSLTTGSTGQQLKKQTQAELSIKKEGEWIGRKYEGGTFENVTSLYVPDQHTDHSFFIRYEGPGWESDKAAYRFYLDWRNGIDFFGKKTSEMVLEGVGLDGFDSYHEPSDWGQDLLKVGNTLGLGSIGRFLNDSLYRFQSVDSVICTVTENGIFESEITTEYRRWETESDQVTLTSILSISAGSPLTTHQVKFDKPLRGFCTGLVKNKEEEFVDKKEGDYRVLATFGKFSLANDLMGLAVIMSNNDIEGVSEGSGSHVVTFKPTDELTYYFFAAWEQDESAIKSMEDFEKLVDQELDRLNYPIKVEVR